MKYIAIASPSGGGKTILANMLAKDKSIGNFKKAISYTTRNKRPNEIHGIDYYFVDKKTFDELYKNNQMLEKELVHNEKYGISKISIEKAKKENADGIVFVVDTNGAEKLKKLHPKETITVFILPPNMEQLEKRLKERGTETPEEISLRLKNARTEIAKYKNFDLLIVNNSLGQAYNDLKLGILSKE